MQLMYTLLFSAFIATTSTNGIFLTESMNNLSNLPLSQKKELFEAYRRSNIELVYTKLNSLRKKWMEKLQKEDIAHPQYRFPTKEIPEKLPSTEIPIVQAITNINRNANISEFFYQSDIILTLAQIEQISENDNPDRVKRQAYRDIYYPHTIWDKTFYYYFSATATDAMKMVFMAAIKYWQEHTCIKFVEDRTAPNRVRVFKGDGCYSYVGRIGGEQDLSLGKGCESVGTAAHELGHALGFFHSQSRVDRDDEISIIVANIQPEFVDQFGKESAATNNNYGMPYDYGSIMHYGASSASRNGRNTMVAKQENYQETMGSDIVAFYDVSMMNEHYNCKVQCSPHSSVSCQNGGYPNPNNCTICNCPSGYGGALCNERPVGCGDILTAGPHFSYIATVIGDGTLKTKIDFDKCNYWIQAPPGKRIQVRLENYEGFTIDGCIYGGVEFKAHADQLRTGYRFCSNADNGIILTSASNLLPVITFNRYGKTKIAFSYRSVDVNGESNHVQESISTMGTPRITIKPDVPCRNYLYNCNVFAFFGYCSYNNIRQKCPSACKQC